MLNAAKLLPPPIEARTYRLDCPMPASNVVCASCAAVIRVYWFAMLGSTTPFTTKLPILLES